MQNEAYPKRAPKVKYNQFDWYLENGFALLTLHNVKNPKEGDTIDDNYGKRPIVKSWRTKESIKKSRAYNAMAIGNNIGARVPSGVVIIDIDPRNGGLEGFNSLASYCPALGNTPTYTVNTSGGGRHLYFRAPFAASIRKTFSDYPGIDFLTEGAMVVIPGSCHYKTGHIYTASNVGPMADLPKAILDLIIKDTSTIPAREQAPTDHLFGIIDHKELDTLLSALDPADHSAYNEQWIPLLCAAHHATGGSIEAQEVFIRWSERDPNHTDKARAAVEKRWDTVRNERGSDTVATVGSILRLVREKKELQDVLGEPLPTGVLELMAAIGDRVIESELEDTSEEGRVDQLLDFINGLPDNWATHNKREMVRLYESIAELDECYWDILCDALGKSKAIPGSFKTNQMAVKRAKDSTKEKKPSYLEQIEQLAQKTIENFQGGKGKGRFAIAPNGNGYVYRGGVWLKLSPLEIERETQIVVRNNVNREATGNKTISDYADKITKVLVSLTEDFSKDFYAREELPSCINLKNGTLWIGKDGVTELKPHNPKDYLVTQLPYDYDPTATCLDFETMLEQVFDRVREDYSTQERDELIRHFWELVGYMIQPNKDIAKILVWSGRGCNGKSKIAKILSKLVGEDAWLNADISAFFGSDSKHSLPAAENKLVIMDEDLKIGTTLNDGALKKVSESTRQAADPKWKDVYTLRLTLTPLIITNNAPYINDMSDGMTRRLDVIEWGVNLSEVDLGEVGPDGEQKKLTESKLPAKVEAEQMPGVLNKAIEGLSRLRKRGKFDMPKCSADFAARLLQASNTVYRFWASVEKEESTGGEYSAKSLYRSYKSTFKDLGYQNLPNYGQFSETLKNIDVTINDDSIKGWDIKLIHIEPSVLSISDN